MRRLEEGGLVCVAGWMQEVTERGIMGLGRGFRDSKVRTMKSLDGFKHDCILMRQKSKQVSRCCCWALLYMFAKPILVDRPRGYGNGYIFDELSSQPPIHPSFYLSLYLSISWVDIHQGDCTNLLSSSLLFFPHLICLLTI